MTGGIESGQLCTVVPIDPTVLEVWGTVLCKVAGNEYLHIVKAILFPAIAIAKPTTIGAPDLARNPKC